MKNKRKLLSVVLALAVVLTSVSSALFAFAAEKPAKVTAFEKFVNNAPSLTYLGSKPTAPNPDDTKKYPEGVNDPKYTADLEKYNERMQQRAAALKWNDDAIAQYKTLSESEKDAVEVKTALTFLKHTGNRIGFDIREEGTVTNSAESQQMAYEKFNELLGKHKTREDAYLLMKVIRDNPIDDEGKQFLSPYTDFAKYPKANDVFAKHLEAVGKASPLARAYAGGVTVMTGFVYYGDTDPYRLSADVAYMFVKQAVAAHPYTEAEPEKAVKPQAKDFATTEEFEAAYAEYIRKDLIYKTWDADRTANFSAPFAFSNIIKFLEETEELRALAPVAKSVYKEGIEFVKSGDTEGCKEAKAAFDALTETEQAQFKEFSATIFKNVYVSGLGTKAYVSTMQYSLSGLLRELDKANDMKFVMEFEEYIMAIDLEKADNEKVYEAYEKYNAVPSAVRKNISEEAMAKYEAVLGCYDPVKPFKPSDDKFDDYIKNYKKTALELPDHPAMKEKNGIKAVADPLIEAAFGLLGVRSLEDVLENGVYTNATVGQFLKVYNILVNTYIDAGIGGINAGPIVGHEGNPSKMKDFLFEEKYAKAIEKMLSAEAAGKAEDPKFEPTEVYNTIKWENGDFGFKDGDRDGFIDAVLAVLRPITKLLSEDGVILIIKTNVKMTDWETADVPHKGDYNYGLYARLIPLLEDIGLNVPSSAHYTAAVKAARAQNKNLGYDALLRPILEAVAADIIDPVTADPFSGVMNLLVRVGHAVSSGLLDASVKDALGNCGGVLAGLADSLDLTADGINAMLTAEPVSIPLSETEVLTVKLHPIPWAELAGCADIAVTESNSYTNAFRIERTADLNLAFAEVFYYLYEVIFEDANYASIKNAINVLLPDRANIVINLTDSLKETGKVQALGILLEILAPAEEPDVKPDPEPDEEPSFPGGKPEDTDDEPADTESPGTGDSRAAIALSVSGLAAAAAVVFISRKKK